MANPTVQSNNGHGITSAPTLAYTTSQTAGNTNIVFLTWYNAGTVTIVDSQSNSYTQVANANSGGMTAWVATGIVGGANTITASGGFSEYNLWIGEYPASAGLRVANQVYNFGGSSTLVMGTLTGAVLNDVVAFCGFDNPGGGGTITSGAGSIGSNTAYQEFFSASYGSGLGVQAGYADGSSPMTCAFLGTAGNVWEWVALAMKPAAAAPTGSVIFDSMNFRAEPRIVRPTLQQIHALGRPRRRRGQ